MLQHLDERSPFLTTELTGKRRWKSRGWYQQARYNGNSREARRMIALAGKFRTALGPVANNPIVALRIERAAELVVLSENLRAALIRGEKVDVSNLLRLEAIADRALRQLGLDHLPDGEKPVPSIAEYLENLPAEDAVGAAQAHPASPPLCLGKLRKRATGHDKPKKRRPRRPAACPVPMEGVDAGGPDA
jgi:hypothetical protein